MSKRYLLILLCLLISYIYSQAQSGVSFSGLVQDSETKEPLPFTTIYLVSESGKIHNIDSDVKGFFSIEGIEKGKYQITIFNFGYETLINYIVITQNSSRTYLLAPLSDTLNEVVITASESKGITSASKIDRTAMEHLQPTSFTDLLSLLPGGTTQTPDMSQANTIRLREAGISSSDFNTTSLGTQFVIDGTPINTSANMQAVASDISTGFDSYNAVNSGVDMRTISTDNIEKVEIIRGIPSVQYNNLTSGVVIIKRRQQATPLQIRIKADQYGKLVSAGKGFEFKNKTVISTDFDFLDSRNDPRDRYNKYKRIGASVRLYKKWVLAEGYEMDLQSNINYSGNIDNVKNDPDIETLKEDSYKSSFHSGGWHNTLNFTAPEGVAFRRLTFNISSDMSWDKIERRRFVQLDRDRTAPVNMEEGEHDAEILPYKYTANVTVDGKPLNLYSKLESEFRFHTLHSTHKVLAGTSLMYAKNFGDGQVYDLTRPLNPISSYYRPRKYSSIPPSGQWQMYLEENATISAGKSHFSIQAGVGTNMQLFLNEKYALKGKLYFDPRLNLQWKFPGIRISGQELIIDLAGGMGWLTMMPTMSQLYPDNLYMDFVQMNYWNPNPSYKRINLMTYIVNPTNYDLSAARNFKWEVRLGFSIHRNELSITYFNEDLESGFRSLAIYSPYEYKKYDTGGIDGSSITAPPALETVPYAWTTVLNGYSYTGNGSRTLKKGVEFQFASERIKAINTRFTVNGAWLNTIYENSEPVYKGVSQVVNGVALSDRYIGLYEVDDSYLREQFNTNFIVDTWLEKIGLKLSATVECMWFSSRQTPKISGVPISYIDVTGTLHPYTDTDKNDPYLKHLVISYSSAVLAKTTTPFYLYVNFKASKDFGKHLSVSFFADRILDYVPDYVQNGYLIRRSAASPYFGMEINIKI